MKKFKLSKAAIKELGVKDLGKILGGDYGDTTSIGETNSVSNSLTKETETITEVEYDS